MRVPATYVEHCMGKEELRGKAGAFAFCEVAGSTDIEATVCCPGCGKEVYRMTEDNGHPLVGPKDCPSTDAVVTFEACCGWRGTMERGYWVRFLAELDG